MKRFVFATLITLVVTTISAAAELSSLVDTAEAKDWELVNELLQQGADVGESQADGMTALHWAAYWRQAETTGRLIAYGCDVDAANHYGVRPLGIAAQLGDEATVKVLLSSGAVAQHCLPSGESVLQIAARTGNVAVVKQLLQHGADLNHADRKGQTALMWAAAEGNSEATGVLIEAGADVFQQTKSGFTAMLFAARQGQTEVVQLLLEAGVDVNGTFSPDRRIGERAPRLGMSPLMFAVENGHFELAMLLVEAGADPNDQRSQFTPLHALSWVRKTHRGDDPRGDPAPRGSGYLTSLDFVRRIVAAGADVNATLEHGKGSWAKLNPRGATPLFWAARSADLPLMKLLVELGADPMDANIEGCTPLMAAAGVGVQAVDEEPGTEPEVLESVLFLLEQGADVNIVDDNKETAMHGAAYRCFPQVVTLLAEHGADPAVWNNKNAWGWTPFAIGEGHRPGSLKPSPETLAALRKAMSPQTVHDQ